jgi:hypothetical protein
MSKSKKKENDDSGKRTDDTADHFERELKLKAMLKQCEFIRDEINNRQNQRSNLTYLLVLALITLWAASATSKISWLVDIGPWLSFFLLYQAYVTYRLHLVQADYEWVVEDNMATLLRESNLGVKDRSLAWAHYQAFREGKRRSPVRKLSFPIVMWISIIVIPLAGPRDFVSYGLLMIDTAIAVVMTCFFHFKLKTNKDQT